MKPALVYDGDCPFCRNYVQFLRLREKFPGIELVDARANPDHPAIDRVRTAGLKIDDGMALVDGGRVLHGEEVIHEIAVRDTGINAAIFSSRRRSATLYPWLRRGRNLVLKILGRSKMGF